MFNPLVLLNKLNFPNDEKENLIKKLKTQRVESLRGSDIGLQRLAASVMIQSTFRGWDTRRKYMAVKYYNQSFKSIWGSFGQLQKTSGFIDLTVQERLRIKYTRYYECYEKVYDSIPEFPDFAAAFIQAMWKMVATRQVWRRYLALKKAERNTRVSSSFRNRLLKYGSMSSRDTQVLSIWDRNAIIIQKAWRSFNGKRIFEFYKRLLSIFKLNNSSRLLKFINPQESKLIEAATGLHLKFRLGGVNYFN